ncbi:hypothetical protein [Arsenophonus apicola]|uniref:hypothetical protein n=1 Tax=Arsenophonus apicola TaxID=2879119 RepID=UPI001CDC2AE5|nr:hypothetical protein [Arsenophonus apicola]UBX30658.1 hypothetical protein LDL57_16005 [Arsenophonus apicola]
MKYILSLLLLMLTLPIAANTLDEIAALEKHKTVAMNDTKQQRIAQKRSTRPFAYQPVRCLISPIGKSCIL